MTIRHRATIITTMPARPVHPKELRPGLFDPPEMPARLRRFGESKAPALLLAPVLAAFFILFVVLSAAAADEPKVTIEGGVQPDNRQFFEWKVTNRHGSPIVFIEFPHYHADIFTPPAGWAQTWKNRAMAGGKDAPGWVQTSVSNPAQGIPSGGSARFQMRLASTGALPRPGKVTVRFADGTEITVANVELPSATSFLENNVMGFGLAALFVIALLVHFRRRDRRRSAAASTSSPTDNKE